VLRVLKGSPARFYGVGTVGEEGLEVLEVRARRR
jgi:hypothetical protein